MPNADNKNEKKKRKKIPKWRKVNHMERARDL